MRNSPKPRQNPFVDLSPNKNLLLAYSPNAPPKTPFTAAHQNPLTNNTSGISNKKFYPNSPKPSINSTTSATTSATTTTTKTAAAVNENNTTYSNDSNPTLKIIKDLETFKKITRTPVSSPSVPLKRRRENSNDLLDSLKYDTSEHPTNLKSPLLKPKSYELLSSPSDSPILNSSATRATTRTSLKNSISSSVKSSLSFDQENQENDQSSQIATSTSVKKSNSKLFSKKNSTTKSTGKGYVSLKYIYSKISNTLNLTKKKN